MITATFQRLQTRIEESGWSVLRFVNLDDGQFQAVGVVADPSRLCEGMDYQLDGQWKTHQKYGRQLAFNSLRQQKAMTRDQVVAYLSKYANGIGLTTAERIFERYGSQAIEMVKHQPDEVAKNVKRVRIADLQKVSQTLKARENNEAVLSELMDMFSGLRIASTTIGSCISLWGLNAPDKIRQDAYCLLHPDVVRCGFPTADKVFLKLGGKPDEHRRLLRCLQHVVETQSTGSTWIHRREVEAAFVRYIVQNGQVPVEHAVAAFPKILADCESNQDIVVKDQMIASWFDCHQERSVSDELKRIAKVRKNDLLYVMPSQNGSILNRGKRKFR